MPVDWEEVTPLGDEGRKAYSEQVQQKVQNTCKELGIAIEPMSILMTQLQVIAEQLWPDLTDRYLFDIDCNTRLLDQIEGHRLDITRAKLMQGVDGNGHMNRADRRQMERDMKKKGFG